MIDASITILIMLLAHIYIYIPQLLLEVVRVPCRSSQGYDYIVKLIIGSEASQGYDYIVKLPRDTII